MQQDVKMKQSETKSQRLALKKVKIHWFLEIFFLISRNFSGADKFARDAFGNDSEHYVTNEFAAIVNDSKTSEETTEDQEDTSPTIENAIQEKDYDKLVKYVLDGESHRLMERTSDDEEMQEFIKNIPAFQGFCSFTDF